MKITRTQLKKIIKEELDTVIQEMDVDNYRLAADVASDDAADSLTYPMIRVAEKMGVPVEELEAILSAEGLSIVSDAAAPMSDDEREDYLSGHGAHKSPRTSTGPVIDGTGRATFGSPGVKEY